MGFWPASPRRARLCAGAACILALSAQLGAAFAQGSAADLERRDKELLAREAELLKVLDSSTSQISSSQNLEKTPAKKSPVKEKAIKPADSSRDKTKSEQSILEAKLSEEQTRNEILVQELNQARNRLLLAETEVERLSAIIDERNKRHLPSYSPKASVAPAAIAAAPAVTRSIKRAPLPTASKAIQQEVAEADMQIITVSADKAHLRTGPGANNSPLMTVSRGTRLAVETRSGDWYRVISPAGTRAWVSSDVVVFGDLSSSARSSGFHESNSDEDDKVFDFISQQSRR